MATCPLVTRRGGVGIVAAFHLSPCHTVVHKKVVSVIKYEEKVKNLLKAQTTCLMSFGPIFVVVTCFGGYDGAGGNRTK